MFSTTNLAANPFALMTSPSEVLDIIGRSEHLARLKSCIYCPLDKPLLSNGSGVDAFDQAIDGSADA